MGQTEPTTIVEQETVVFMDGTAGQDVGMKGTNDDMVNDGTISAELGSFLKRPVRIATYEWLETDIPGPFSTHTFNPWQLYFNDAAIKRKLYNYSWLRANLHVKVVVNASPFYYGALLMSYRPLTGLNEDSIITTGLSSDIDNHLIARSQRPHIWVFPQNNEGGDLKLPFVWHKNWLNINSQQDFIDMGQITTDVVYMLQSANGTTGTGVSVQVYAWAEDVQLSGPTVGVALQSRDEYGEGPVSAPASALANLAGRFVNMGGMIGKVATATRIGAGAISGVAKLFGFTNVPVIDPIHAFKPLSQPMLASPAIGFPTEKLTLDPKNELTIDSRAVGIDKGDELDISTLVQHESVISAENWNTSMAVNDRIFSAAVTPWIFENAASDSSSIMQLVPMAWVAMLFQNWRGDVIYKFSFIKSKYHRGRVVISYDPTGVASSNIINTSNTASQVFTRIVDLETEDSVEIRIPYGQASPFLLLDTVRLNRAVNASYVYDGTKHNGTITMRVLNKLSAPVASSTIGVLVSVRGAENLEFANPTKIEPDYSPFIVQSATEVIPTSNSTVAGDLSVPNTDQYLINFGEKVVSLRQILRRFSLNELWWEKTNTSSALVVLNHRFGRFPIPFGYAPNGFWNAQSVLFPASSEPFNYTRLTPLNWIMPAFVGVRGSMQWHFNIRSESSAGFGQVTHASVERTPESSYQPTRATFTQTAKATDGTLTGTPLIRDYINNLPGGESGAALTNCNNQTGLTVQLPNYNPYLFQSTSPQRIVVPSDYDLSTYDLSLLRVITSPSVGATTRGLLVEKYCAIGTDFNLSWFLNVPSFVQYDSSPAQRA